MADKAAVPGKTPEEEAKAANNKGATEDAQKRTGESKVAEEATKQTEAVASISKGTDPTGKATGTRPKVKTARKASTVSAAAGSTGRRQKIRNIRSRSRESKERTEVTSDLMQEQQKMQDIAAKAEEKAKAAKNQANAADRAAAALAKVKSKQGTVDLFFRPQSPSLLSAAANKARTTPATSGASGAPMPTASLTPTSAHRPEEKAPAQDGDGPTETNQPSVAEVSRVLTSMEPAVVAKLLAAATVTAPGNIPPGPQVGETMATAVANLVQEQRELVEKVTDAANDQGGFRIPGKRIQHQRQLEKQQHQRQQQGGEEPKKSLTFGSQRSHPAAPFAGAALRTLGTPTQKVPGASSTSFLHNKKPSGSAAVVVKPKEEALGWLREGRCVACGGNHPVFAQALCPAYISREVSLATFRKVKEMQKELDVNAGLRQPRQASGMPRMAPWTRKAPPSAAAGSAAALVAAPAPPSSTEAQSQAPGTTRKRTREPVSSGITPDAKRSYASASRTNYKNVDSAKSQVAEDIDRSQTLFVRETDGEGISLDRFMQLKEGCANQLWAMFKAGKEPHLATGWEHTNRVARITMATKEGTVWMRDILSQSYLVETAEEYQKAKLKTYKAFIPHRGNGGVTGRSREELAKYIAWQKVSLGIKGHMSLKTLYRHRDKGIILELNLDDEAEHDFWVKAGHRITIMTAVGILFEYDKIVKARAREAKQRRELASLTAAELRKEEERIQEIDLTSPDKDKEAEGEKEKEGETQGEGGRLEDEPAKLNWMESIEEEEKDRNKSDEEMDDLLEEESMESMEVDKAVAAGSNTGEGAKEDGNHGK